MVKASGQIEKELGLLQQRTEDMSKNLDTLYDGYLKALGAAGAQQLMSAVYHLCTQAYPDKFLALSWNQRNELQTSLQTLAAQIQVQLNEQRSQAQKNSRKPSKSSGLAFLQRLLEARSSGAIIHTHEGSSEDLLDKLSEIARFESGNKRKRSSSRSHQSEHADNADDGLSSVHKGPDNPASEKKEAENVSIDSDEMGLNALEDDLEIETPESQPESQHETTQRLDLDSAAFDSVAETSDRDKSADVSNTDQPGSDQMGSDQRVVDQALTNDFDFEMDVPAAENRLSVSDEEDLLGALEALARRASDDDEDTSDAPLAPIHLLKQQMLIEKAIRDVFRTVSEATNELLQKASVMPNFPKALMAAAAETQGLGESANSVPNVVKVSVRVMHGEANFEEAPLEDADFEEVNFEDDLDDLADEMNKQDKDWRRMRNMRPDAQRRSGRKRAEQSKNERNDRPTSNGRRNPKHRRSQESRRRRQEARSPRSFLSPDAIEIEAFPEFAVVNLQLSEVEFVDPRVSVWRGRLRKELSHLKQLGLRYKKTQKKLEVAQAEDAWRSSWTALEES